MMASCVARIVSVEVSTPWRFRRCWSVPTLTDLEAGLSLYERQQRDSEVRHPLARRAEQSSKLALMDT